MKIVMKKILTIVLCICLMLGVVPVSVMQVKAASNGWCWPTSVQSLRSDWPTYSSGNYHGGTDFAVPLNSPVYSTCDGEVVAVTSLTTSYGKHIKIKAIVNGNAVYMRYCHLNSFAVSKGERVRAGQLIGYSGSTGNSTGPHLHYEVRNAQDTYGNTSNPNLNPRNYLPGSSYTFETTSTVAWEKDNRYPTPISTYPTATSGKITVYNANLTAYDLSTRNIAYDDLCTINAVYTNGYCSVTYPTSSGTNTEYAKLSDFISNSVTPYSWSPSNNVTTYMRQDMSATFGSVFSTDSCTVVGKTGSLLQIIYPISSGGYKMGWVKDTGTVTPSDFVTPLYAYNASADVRTTVYESLSTMGTYYGQIFVDDKCTLNVVNVAEGWVNVSYPASGSTKTGYAYLNEFVPTNSKLTTFYDTTVTQQSPSYRKADMAVSYGYVSAGDKITVVGRDGNKLQIIYPVDTGGYKLAWIYNTYVNKNLIGISVTANPTKTTYLEGQNLDTTGLVVTANYDDGSTQNITNACTFSGYSNTVGVKTITANYGGKQTAFTVQVKSKSPTAITVVSEPTKKEYYVGETLDFSGLVIKATYDNGTTAEISNYDAYIDDTITDSVGNKTITVTYVYNDVMQTTSFEIRVISPNITVSPTVLTLEEGKTSTISVSVTPASQSIKWESSNTSVVTVSNGQVTAISAGNAEITASFQYNNRTYKAKTQVQVTKKPVTISSISVESLPTKTVYEIGEAFKSEGLVLKITYSDGTTGRVTTGYTLEGFDSSRTGTKIITVYYQNKTTSFSVTIKEPESVLSVGTFKVNNQKVNSGEEVKIQISIKDNPGIIGFRLKVQYPSDVLQLINAQKKDLTGVSFGPLSNMPFSILWTEAISGDMSDDLIIAELTFKVADNAVAGTYPITLSYDEEDVFNSKWETITFETENGTVTVNESQHNTHNYQATIGKDATCTKNGVQIYRCTECGDSYSEDIPALGHTYETQVIGATCTENGYTIYSCRVCDDGYLAEFTSATGHTFTWIIDKEASVEENGIKHEECVVCQYKRNENTIIEKLENPEGKPEETPEENPEERPEGKPEETPEENPEERPEGHQHTLIEIKAIAATCIAKGNITYYTCAECKKSFSDSNGKKEITLKETILPTVAHTYITTVEPATPEEEGTIIEECSVCGDTNSFTAIPYPEEIELSKTTYTYTGKALKPRVIVQDSEGKKISSANYTVSYRNNKEIGTAEVIITFKGNYSGTIIEEFTINPKKTSLSKVTAISKGFIAKWKKADSITGYQIQYSTSKKFVKAKNIIVNKKNKVSYKVSKLLGKKKYYVRIRTYKTVKKEKYYSAWSNVKKVTIKG